MNSLDSPVLINRKICTVEDSLSVLTIASTATLIYIGIVKEPGET